MKVNEVLQKYGSTDYVLASVEKRNDKQFIDEVNVILTSDSYYGVAIERLLLQKEGIDTVIVPPLFCEVEPKYVADYFRSYFNQNQQFENLSLTWYFYNGLT